MCVLTTRRRNKQTSAEPQPWRFSCREQPEVSCEPQACGTKTSALEHSHTRALAHSAAHSCNDDFFLCLVSVFFFFFVVALKPPQGFYDMISTVSKGVCSSENDTMWQRPELHEVNGQVNVYTHNTINNTSTVSSQSRDCLCVFAGILCSSSWWRAQLLVIAIYKRTNTQHVLVCVCWMQVFSTFQFSLIYLIILLKVSKFSNLNVLVSQRDSRSLSRKASSSKKSGFTCNFVLPTSDFTGFGRKPRLDSTSSHLDGKTPAVSRTSAEAASAIFNIFSFQNTCVGSGKRKGPRLWLRSLSVPPDIFGATAPTRYPTFFPQPRLERALCSVSHAGWPCFSRPTPSASARPACGEARPWRRDTWGCWDTTPSWWGGREMRWDEMR